MITKKLFYEDFYFSECTAKVIGKSENKLILDQTIAFPEGGGQKGDRGVILFHDQVMPFYDTQKGVGRLLILPNFPTIQVDTPIYHFMKEDDIDKLTIGCEVQVKIDIAFRIRTTALHTALHIALMAANEIVPEKVKNIKGCSITDEYGRLDFFTNERFTPEEIAVIEKKANEIITKNYFIESYHHQNEDEAWYWKCDNFICPCGGTHLKSTGEVGSVNVKRKNAGKSLERLIVTLSNIQLKEAIFKKRI